MSAFDRFSEPTAWETEERREERERRDEVRAEEEVAHRDWLENVEPRSKCG